jgi:hypothetical protein
MSRTLTVELPEEVYDALTRLAEASGTTAAGLLASNAAGLMRRRPVAKRDDGFERHFGTLSLDPPITADNAAIDAALVEEYGRGLNGRSD